jgi:signal transduction histidine kinase
MADRSEHARLRQLVWFDVAIACAAVALISATFVVVERSGWLLVLATAVAISGLAMAAGLLPLDRGDLGGAVLCLALANWFVAVVASSIATFAWPLMVLAALLPTALAAPYVSGRLIRWYVVASLLVAMSVAALGLLQDFSGFENQLPEWTPVAIVLLFTPFLAAMLLITALQHSSRLQSALSETLAANAALASSRSRVVVAADRERRRVERDLHDGAQQRLIALRLRLRRAEQECRSDPETVPEVFAELRDQVRAVHEELRDLAHGVYPPVLTQHGLAEALAAAAHRCPLPVVVDAARTARLDPEIEAAIYFCCAEALQNAAKHAGPDAHIRLALTADADEIRFVVADDGAGFDTATLTAVGGIESLRDRLSTAGGTLDVIAAPGKGTIVTGRVPV